MTTMIPALCSEDELRGKITDTETEDLLDGSRVHVQFTNGWGLSVVRNSCSYGGREGLFEAAVTGPDGRTDFDNPVTPNDPAGWLTAEGVIEKMRSLSAYSAEELKYLRDVCRYQKLLIEVEEVKESLTHVAPKVDWSEPFGAIDRVTAELDPDKPVSLVKTR